MSRRPRTASRSSGYFEGAPMDDISDWRSRPFRPPPDASDYHDERNVMPDMSRRRDYDTFQQPSHFDHRHEPAGDYRDMPYRANDPRQHLGRPHEYDELSLRNEPRNERDREAARRRFDPACSRNPFVNGDIIYRFVWGDPLCCRCGMMGHLPQKCQEEPMSWAEQDYLHDVMRKAKDRTKAEAGQSYQERTANLKSVSRPLSDRPPIREERPREFTPEAGAQARVEEWRRANIRPNPENSSPLPFKPAPAPMMENDRWDMRPLESQEDQFAKFKADRRKWPPQRMAPPAVPSLPARDDYSFSTGSDAGDFQILGRAKAPKKKEQKTKGQRDKQGVVNFDVETELTEPANADAKLPHVVDVNSIQEEPSVHLQPVPTPADAANQLRLIPLGTHMMGASVRLSNGEAQAVGPHPSTIRVSARYLTQAAIEKYLSPASLDPQERSQAEAREDSLRLQGVAWIDNVRRALQLPVRTYTSACVFYHKFRLAHPFHEYSFSDAAAASLLNACKAEDTLKKSKDILAAAYNLKQPAGHEHVSADDPIFEGPSRTIIGLERLVLESSSFDFTNRAPHDMLVKVAKSLPRSEDKRAVCQLAWTALTDIHRTFAPLKQTSATLSLACLELAAHFKAATSPDNTCAVRDHLQELDLNRWYTTREEVMEILLDALDMYTHHTTQTILGTQYSLDDFLRIRLALNKECTDSSIPRHTIIQPPASPDNGTSTTLRVSNGHPTPVSPPQAGTQPPPTPGGIISSLPIPEGGGTLRFMLNPQRATDERAEVSKYYTEEYEEYEEEIEVPIPQRDRSPARDRDRDRRRDERYEEGRRSVRDDRPPPPPGPLRDRERDRESLRDRERDAERERARVRDRDRDRRYDDRRYDDRERDRRYDDRRERDRDRDRRYDDDYRRRRDDRR